MMINKNIFYTVIFAIGLFSCTSEKEGTMVVEGTIQGMKKGMLYLQKFQDTALVSVDSIFLNGKSTFRLVDNIESPEIYYLTLNQLEKEKIDFFGEKGTIIINTKLEKFGTSAQISGSKIHETLEEYRKMVRQFQGRNLDIIKETFDAQIAKDDELVDKLNKESERLLKNRLRYTASFALRNNDSEIAPFLALTELNNAHITLLDTVNNSLSKSVKGSKYGVALDKYIKDIKKSEVQ